MSAEQHPPQGVHLVATGPDRQRQIDRPGLVAGPALDLQLIAAAVDRIRDERRGRIITADELQRRPCLTIQPVRLGELPIGGSMGGLGFPGESMERILALAQFGGEVPAIATGQRDVDDAWGHAGIRALART